MCTNRKEIITRDGRKMFVDCGHCDACQQQRANNNTFKIRSECAETDNITLFVTLTYMNKYIPYIRKSDFEKYDGVFPIYRDFDVRRVRVVPRKFSTRYGRFVPDVKNVFYDFKDRPCGVLDYCVPRFPELVSKCPTVRAQRQDLSFFNMPDKVGVIYYQDLQNFFKRLSTNYHRLYHEYPSYSFFGVAEYGPNTKRPHFHISLHIPKDKVDEYIEAIVKSWRYSSEKRLRRYIEIARDVSSYLSAYVNTHTTLSAFYYTKEISPKCTHSKHYGFNRFAFSLDEIEKKISNRDLSFSYTIVTKSSTHVVNRLLPKYVLSYWFPKIQGFSKLTSDKLVEVYSNPRSLAKYARALKYDTDEKIDILDEYNDHKVGVRRSTFHYRISEFIYNFRSDPHFMENEERVIMNSPLHRNIVMLLSARKRYYKEHCAYPSAVDIEDNDLYRLYFDAQKLAVIDSRYVSVMLELDAWIKERETIYDAFAQTAVRCWKVFASNLLRQMYDIPIKSRYENIYLFYESKSDLYPQRGKARFPSMPYVDYEVDVNKNTYNNMLNSYLVDKFLSYDKAKKFYNTIYSYSLYDM